jgi:DNA-binding transcriptional MerR regulator
MSDQTRDIPAREHEYTLDELSTLANVTPRTVRYYIAEDLLPPPIIGGRNATYSQEHLDRLMAIGAMKDMYLPLREIRHRLNTLTPEQMRDPAYLATLSQAVAVDRAMTKRMHPRARPESSELRESAAEYLDHVDGRRSRDRHRDRPVVSHAMAAPEPPSTTWERFPLGDDAELLMRTSKVQRMGPGLHRMLHRLRHMIENEDNGRSRS